MESEKALRVMQEIETDVMVRLAEALGVVAREHNINTWRNVTRFASAVTNIFQSATHRGEGAPSNVIHEYATVQRRLFLLDGVGGTFMVPFALTQWLEQYADLLDAEAEEKAESAFESTDAE